MKLELKIKREKRKRRLRAVILLLSIFLHIRGSSEIISSPLHEADVIIRVRYHKATSSTEWKLVFFGNAYYLSFDIDNNYLSFLKQNHGGRSKSPPNNNPPTALILSQSMK